MNLFGVINKVMPASCSGHVLKGPSIHLLSFLSKVVVSAMCGDVSKAQVCGCFGVVRGWPRLPGCVH